MDDALLPRVRRFNRLVAERIGALSDRYLARDRPLGEARLLWEIGQRGADVRELRRRLGLDSGHLSRQLRALEADGMVRVRPAASDRRVRVAELSPRGRREWRRLDERSDALAGSMVAPLSARQRNRLTSAMDEVERLLTASAVEVRSVPLTSRDARHCLAAYFAEIDGRIPGGYDPDRALPATAEELSPPEGLFLVARLRERPIACGGVRRRSKRTVEIKRMWVSPEARGLGLGRRLLLELERHALELGATRARLDSNAAFHEALGLYRASGYVEVPAFNTEPYATHWMEKRLRRRRG